MNRPPALLFSEIRYLNAEVVVRPLYDFPERFEPVFSRPGITGVDLEVLRGIGIDDARQRLVAFAAEISRFLQQALDGAE